MRDKKLFNPFYDDNSKEILTDIDGVQKEKIKVMSEVKRLDIVTGKLWDEYKEAKNREESKEAKNVKRFRIMSNGDKVELPEGVSSRKQRQEHLPLEILYNLAVLAASSVYTYLRLMFKEELEEDY